MITSYTDYIQMVDDAQRTTLQLSNLICARSLAGRGLQPRPKRF